MSSPFTVVVDTREQLPWSFAGIQTVDETMETGDYSIVGFEDTFAIERKSLGDYISSLMKPERERFGREIERGLELSEFKVIVEASKEDVRDENYWVDVHPNGIFRMSNSLKNEYGVDIEWVGSREKAKNRTLGLLSRWWSKYK